MSKFTKSARGQPCQIRIPGVCRMAPENKTTVLAHLNGAGMAIKHDDRHAAFSCFHCHGAVDGSIKTKFTKDELELMHLKGVIRTQQIWINMGLM